MAKRLIINKVINQCYECPCCGELNGWPTCGLLEPGNDIDYEKDKFPKNCPLDDE